MKTLKMETCGTIKVVNCPRLKEKIEPVPNCDICNRVVDIDYRKEVVKCKYEEPETKGSYENTT